MKLSKKITIISLLACFVLCTVLAVGITSSASPTALAAQATDVSHYFYDQLGAEQKQFYDAMVQMHVKGLFVKGEDYDLLANKHVTEAQLEAFANGDQTILKVMAAARDAFYTDYADIFYVDFGALSLRVTQDANGKYHAYLGSGRYDTYYVTGFNGEASVNAAIKEYETARDRIVDLAKAAKPTQDQIDALGAELATQIAQIREAHKQIALATVYRLETTCTPGNEGHVRTPYGVFVKGQALCEGYSRAFKAVMDELGVPCVLVNGVYRHSGNQQELHMWCHVQLDGEWYAVDQTFDDVNGTKPTYGVQSGEEYNYDYTEDYFLKGATFMNNNHATSPYKSEAEYAFTYPELSLNNLGAESTAHGLFVITQEPHNGAMNSTDITVSVFIDGEWCGYADAVKKGYYIVMRHEGNYLPELLNRAGDLSDLANDSADIGNSYLAWGYVNPVPEMFPNIEEHDGYTIIKNESKSTGFEFAVTNVPPRPYDWDNRFDYTADQAAEMFTYLGDPTTFTARSGLIQTKYGDPDYQPAPHIVRSTPTHLTKLETNGYSYDVTVEYDQMLELIPNEDGSTPELQVTVYGMRATGEVLKGTNAVKLDVIREGSLTWTPGEELPNGTYKGGTISFYFTPSELYAHDNILYFFNFNLRGVNSGKQINPIEYCAGAPSLPMCYLAYGYHWSIFGQPQLLENDDLSREGWVTSDGTDASQSKDRLALVVSAPSKKQESEMNGLLSDELGLSHQEDGALDEGAFESFTYNIQLTICKAVVLETGQGVRICVGFPEGFTYDDSLNGVKFTAYHFMHDKQNNIIGVEEIECTVTPLGLILMCKSFSPFAIVARKSNEEVKPNADKTVIVSTTTGGTAYAEVDGKKSNLFTVKQGETRTLEVAANNGYVIESIKIGSNVYVSDSGKMSLTLNYNDLEAQNIVEVSFVAQSVKAAEVSRGESGVIQSGKNDNVQQVKKAEITVNNTTVSVKAGSKLELKATVNEPQNADSNNYQWYKDGEAIDGQTNATLTIKKATANDAGIYTLHVTSAFGASTATAVSEKITVTVQEVEKHELTSMEKGFIIAGGCVVGIGLLMLLVLVIVKKRA